MKRDPNDYSKIKTGTVEVDGDITDPKNQKLRITTWLDGDIYDELKSRADDGEGKGRYQTLMNDLLRKILFEKSAPVINVVAVSELKSLLVEQEKFITLKAIDGSIKKKKKTSSHSGLYGHKSRNKSIVKHATKRAAK